MKTGTNFSLNCQKLLDCLCDLFICGSLDVSLGLNRWRLSNQLLNYGRLTVKEGIVIHVFFTCIRNAPPVRLPPSVGFKVGDNSTVKYLIVEITHYKDILAARGKDCISGLDFTLPSKGTTLTESCMIFNLISLNKNISD